MTKAGATAKGNGQHAGEIAGVPKKKGKEKPGKRIMERKWMLSGKKTWAEEKTRSDNGSQHPSRKQKRNDKIKGESKKINLEGHIKLLL